MSWPYMKVVCWTALIATLFAQNLERLSQVRLLLLLLLLSASAVGGFTAWQYVRGMGLKIAFVGPGSALYDAGLRPEDTLVGINDHSIHKPADIVHAVASVSPQSGRAFCVALPFAIKKPSPGRQISRPTAR